MVVYISVLMLNHFQNKWKVQAIRENKLPVIFTCFENGLTLIPKYQLPFTASYYLIIK